MLISYYQRHVSIQAILCRGVGARLLFCSFFSGRHPKQKQVEKELDSSDKLLVFFPSERKKMGVKPIRQCPPYFAQRHPCHSATLGVGEPRWMATPSSQVLSEVHSIDLDDLCLLSWFVLRFLSSLKVGFSVWSIFGLCGLREIVHLQHCDINSTQMPNWWRTRTSSGPSS